MKNVFTTLILITLFAAVTPAAFADSYQGSYTPCNTYNNNCIKHGSVIINKTVANPKSGDFVENLGVNDAKFAPESIVSFQLTVINTSKVDIDKATVKDIFPEFLSFNSGAGNFDSNTKTLTFEVSNLKAGESRSFTVTGKTAKAADMPNDQAVICKTNQSFVHFHGQQNQDNASFCIEKQASPVISTKGGVKIYPSPNLKTTPATGPETAILFGLVPMGAAGLLLRKKTTR